MPPEACIYRRHDLVQVSAACEVRQLHGLGFITLGAASSGASSLLLMLVRSFLLESPCRDSSSGGSVVKRNWSIFNVDLP